MAEARDAGPRVLFACTFNAVRSPIAAALLRHYAGPHMRIASAGVHLGRPDPFAMAVMEEIGIDLTRHEPCVFADLERQLFDTIITLSPEAHHHALEFTRIMPVSVEYWPTFDPSVLGEGAGRQRIAAAYRELRDALAERVRQRFAIEGGPSV